MTKEEYIESIVSQIDDKAAREEFRIEIADHLDDRIAFYTDAGYDYDYALEKAIGRMGDTATVGAQMNNLYDTSTVNKAIWTMALIQCVLAAVFAISGAADYYFTPYIIIHISFVLYTVTFFLASRHKNYIALCLISTVSLVGFSLFPLIYDLFADTMYHDHFREVIIGLNSASATESITSYIMYKKYVSMYDNPYFLQHANSIQIIFDISYYFENTVKFVFYPVSCLIGMFYAAKIKNAIIGKASQKSLKRFSRINTFNISCAVFLTAVFIANVFIFIENLKVPIDL